MILRCAFGDRFYHKIRIPKLKLKIPGKVFFKSESRTSVTFKLQFLTLYIYQWQRFGLRMGLFWMVSLERQEGGKNRLISGTNSFDINHPKLINSQQVRYHGTMCFSRNFQFTVVILDRRNDRLKIFSKKYFQKYFQIPQIQKKAQTIKKETAVHRINWLIWLGR